MTEPTLVSMPLAAVGIDRVVAIVWGICTKRYTAGNSLDSSGRHVDHFCPRLPGITPGLKDHRYSSTPGITPDLKDHLCRLLGNLYLVLHRWEFPGIAPQSSWNTAGYPSWYYTRTRGPPSLLSSLESLGLS